MTTQRFLDSKGKLDLMEQRVVKRMIKKLSFSRSWIWLVACVVCLLPVSTSTSWAQVTVNTVVLTFKAKDRPVQTVMIGNSSSNPAYVLASVEKVLDPESGGNKAEPSEDILASPKAFSIEAGGQRAVRLLMRVPPPEKEAVYRALFVPQDRGFGQEIKREFQGRRASIRVLTGMGVLVFVEPQTAVKDFKWTRSDSGMTFSNGGTLHEELSNVQSCDREGNACVGLPGKRVYAGTSYDLKVPGDRKVTFLARSGSAGEYEQMSVDPVGTVSSSVSQDE